MVNRLGVIGLGLCAAAACGGGGAKPLDSGLDRDGGGGIEVRPPDVDGSPSDTRNPAADAPDGASDGGGGGGSDASLPAPDTLLRSLALGRDHTCSLDSGGTVWCWGGGTTAEKRPKAVTGLPEAVVSLSAAADGRTCAIGVSRAVWCWTDAQKPVSIAGLTKVAQLAVGPGFACAIDSAGKAWCWGKNEFGQLGDGTIVSRPAPATIPSITDALEIGVGDAHACVRRADRTVWCWGANDSWQLGDGSTVGRYGPVRVLAVPRSVAQLAIGPRHSCARLADGAVWCWGANGAGEASSAGTTYVELPTEFQGLGPSEELRAGGYYIAGDYHYALTCSRRRDGSLWCAGRGANGELGDGTLGGDGTDSPVRALGINAPIEEMAIGGRHSCALGTDKRLWCWGYNAYGQLGRDNPYVSVPARLEGLGPFTEIAAGHDSTMGRTLDRYFSWGSNAAGQLGIGAAPAVPNPLALIGIPVDVKTWGVGGLYSCWIRTAGQVLCTGGKFGNHATVVTAVGTDNADLKVGNGHACVLKNSGNVWCWGITARGPSTAEADPALFEPGANQGIYLGVNTTCIKGATGAINCTNGEFGNSAFPLPVGMDTVDVTINGHWCARKIDGTVSCGIPPSGSKQIAIADVTDIALTRSAACARKVDGTVWCWGKNTRGVLGVSGPDQEAPAQVLGLTAAVKLTAGDQHVCALDGTGRIWCWGDNQLSQLGDGLGGDRAQPAVTAFP